MKPTSNTDFEHRPVRGERLTDRQTEVLGLVAEGLENKEIGHRIGITEQAVKEHVSALLRRFAVRNHAALAEIDTELRIAGTMALPTEWLGYIYEKSPVASAVVKGPEHVYVAANNAYRRAAGTDNVLGRRIIDVFPNASAPALAGLAEVVATGKTKVVHELPGHWYRDGVMTDGFVDVIWQALPRTEGAVIIWGLDVTDEVRARQSVAELSAERMALLDLVSTGVVVFDTRGSVLKVNRAAQSLLGAGPYPDLSSESARPYRVRDAATGLDLPPVEEALTRALRGEHVRDLRIRMFVPALGRDVSLRIDAERLVATEGVVRGVIAAITEDVRDPLLA